MRQIFFVLFTGLFLGGCATTRVITINSKPAEANIKVDGVDVGRAPITQPFTFQNKQDAKRITASKLGFKDTMVQLTQEYDQKDITLELKPQTRRVHFTIVPVPAVVSVNGKPITNDPTDDIATTLEFTVDARNQWTSYKVSAERQGYEPAEQTVTWADQNPNYTLNLDPIKKDLKITSNPAGATVTIDGEKLGVTPLTDNARPFPVDPSTNAWVPHKIRLEKPGYDPVDSTIAWDDGKTDYHYDFTAKTKNVRIVTDPSGATVSVDGTEAAHAADGSSVLKLAFPAIDDKGTLKGYVLTITKKTADSEWEPAKLPIAWDEGKQDYTIQLKEILTRPVSLLTAQPSRADDGWQFSPVTINTIAMKDVTEGRGKESPTQLTRLPKGSMIDTVVVSPDGNQMLFTMLTSKNEKDLRSVLQIIRTDGSGGADYLSDGKSLDLTPSFTPDGKQIVFSSNRAGKRQSVWLMSASGAPGVTQLTTGDTNDFWPTIDSDPKPRLFYQALVDTRSDPRLYMTQLGTTIRTDLTQQGGTQPRVSPKGDAIIFSAVNDKTGKRDIYRMSDKGGDPQNLTNTPDSDEFEPAWSPDGGRIAFVSDRGVDQEKRSNYDIWTMDPNSPERPTQITTNGSWDDSPTWEPSGNAIFFRSNRGGDWAIWRVSLKK